MLTKKDVEKFRAKCDDHAPHEKAKWCDEFIQSDRFLAICIIKAFELSDILDLDIVLQIFKAYELDHLISLILTQSELAIDYLELNDQQSLQLNHISKDTAKILADKVDELGIELLLGFIPEEEATVNEQES